MGFGCYDHNNYDNHPNSCGFEETEKNVVTLNKDTHFDGLSNTKETYYGTDPNDRDTDDDGVLDGEELFWNKDTDGDGRINAMDPDSDNDGLTDGTEMGRTEPVSGMGAGVKGN